MYNLQVPGGGGGQGAAGPAGDGGSLATTPRTPEILNSLIAMTNPFESAYARATHHHHSHHGHHAPRLASSPPGGSDNSTSSSGSGGGCVSPPSVQSTCSQLIKEGLKLTIQSKRRQKQPEDGGDGDDERKMARRDEVRDDDDDSTGEGLTPEDEERRKRRRERNKIAATKCRLKKRERTVNLVHESEILENQNHDLKSQIQELETQRRRLVDMLSIHRPSCQKQLPMHAPLDSPFPTTTYQTYCRPSSVMESGSSMFRRINVNASSTYPRTKPTVEATTSYHRIEMSSTSCVESPYQRVEPDPYGRPEIVYHGFSVPGDAETPEPPPPPYCRADDLQGSPTFVQIGEPFTCAAPPPFATEMDRFVKPELPPFHSPAASYHPPYPHYEEADAFISTDFTSRSALAE